MHSKVLAICLLAGCATAAVFVDPRYNDEHFRYQEAVRNSRQLTPPPIQETVRNNLLDALYRMANASAIAGTDVSRSAATVIRGFVQDSFNLGSLGVYIPRLVFLDGPSQFIETMRLVRQGQIRVPTDMDTAIDTLINFAATVRDSPVTGNLVHPFVSFFPNIFRGAETLVGSTLFNVFSWLSPISPGDISSGSQNTYLNRWDTLLNNPTTTTTTTTTTQKPEPPAASGRHLHFY